MEIATDIVLSVQLLDVRQRLVVSPQSGDDMPYDGIPSASGELYGGADDVAQRACTTRGLQ